MAVSFATRSALLHILSSLTKDFSVIVSVGREGAHRFARFAPLQHVATDPGDRDGKWPELTVEGARTVEPLKGFAFEAKRRVAEDFESKPAHGERKPFCIVGARACDLAAFKILDSVFLDSEYHEPYYAAARSEDLVIAADCTRALDVCFCLAVGGQPYPTEGCDIALSQIEAGLLVEPRSERGEKLLGEHSGELREATEEELTERDQMRSEVATQVGANLRAHEIPTLEALAGAVRANYDDPLWREEAEKCVECGACNTICPTCHCFLLFDRLDDERLVRYRLWDSCLIKDFARVAGGANPRPELWMRLRNRFEKKFDFFPNLIGRYACTGCGRCILACPAEIDIRRVLRRSVENVQKR